MVEEQFVSFETAKLLKEKGFDLNCLYRYDKAGNLIQEAFYSNWNFQTVDYAAPTQSLAMRWLREVHSIFISPRIQNDGTYICYLYDTKGNGIQGYDKNLVQATYEQACESAIKYCLENLI